MSVHNWQEPKSEQQELLEVQKTWLVVLFSLGKGRMWKDMIIATINRTRHEVFELLQQNWGGH